MSAADCIFCKIAEGRLPADIVFQDDHVVVFRDIHPQAPVHLLVIPREHVATMNDATDMHAILLGHMLLVARRVAREQGAADNGYRLIINTNADAGQVVFHLHLHILAGRRLGPLG